MASYNKYLLTDILRKEWGFEGVVVSDWGGTHDTRQPIFKGLDMEFGTLTFNIKVDKRNDYNNYYLAKSYLDLIIKGEAGIGEPDEKVHHILRLSFLTTMNRNKPFGSFGSPEHGLAGRKIAEEGVVLLKNNDHVLPIDLHKTRKIAVIGENAVKMMTG